jgi:hypothetical protein
VLDWLLEFCAYLDPPRGPGPGRHGAIDSAFEQVRRMALAGVLGTDRFPRNAERARKLIWIKESRPSPCPTWTLYSGIADAEDFVNYPGQGCHSRRIG